MPALVRRPAACRSADVGRVDCIVPEFIVLEALDLDSLLIPPLCQPQHQETTMAAAAVSSRARADIRTSGTYNVRLGATFQRSGERLTSVRYNHRPNIVHTDDATLSIVSDGDDSATMLSLKDGDEEYEYKGRPAEEKQTYVLIPTDEGDGFVLEQLKATHTYNLTSAPWETNATTLAEQYPTLATEHDIEQAQTDLFGEDDKADDDNPFDFRHYIKSSIEALSPDSARPQKSRDVSQMSSCLLYTSPSPRDGLLSRMPSSA